VRRATRGEPAIEVEFDGLLVGCDRDGRVTGADVLDPDDRGRGAAVGRRVLVGVVGLVLVLEIGNWVPGWPQGLAAVVAIPWAVGLGYLALRDERERRPLPARDAPAVVERQAVLRRLDEASGFDPHPLPERGHRLLWAVAGGGPAGDEALAAHVALAAERRGAPGGG
jgi:hypothetical protein